MHFLIQHTFSAILVGEALLRQNALLLPDVYDSFLNKLKQVIQVHHITTGSSEIGNTVTSNWFWSKPPSLLDHHLAYRCCVKKHGTLLYRHGGVLLHALNITLDQTRHQKHQRDSG